MKSSEPREILTAVQGVFADGMSGWPETDKEDFLALYEEIVANRDAGNEKAMGLPCPSCGIPGGPCDGHRVVVNYGRDEVRWTSETRGCSGNPREGSR